MKKTLMITLIGVLAIVLSVVSFSYAYYTFRFGDVHGSVSANITVPECLSYSITSNSLSLSGDLAAPIQDYKVLGLGNNGKSALYKTTFTITNNCTDSNNNLAGQNLYIGLALNDSVVNSPVLLNSIKYALYGTRAENNNYLDARFLKDGVYHTLSDEEVSILENSGLSATGAYELTEADSKHDGSIPQYYLPFETASYELYLWISYDENGTNNLTQNMDFSSFLIIGIKGE